MKKILTIVALLAATLALQAQTKFHDVEANEAKGPVKIIRSEVMGRPQVTNFTKEGKMQREGLSDVVYNEEGYPLSFTVSAEFGTITMKLEWENGRVKKQSANVMGQEMVTTLTYDENGYIKSQAINMGGQEFSTPYTDYKFDSRGNWISRKTSMMGQEITQERTIEYYE